MAKILLEAANIRHAYGLRTILKIDALHLCDGDRVGLIGENGAGKSTLLSILSGELTPDAGEVLARLNLRGGDALKPVGVLSGGERGRVALARLLLSDANLLLDEPTNHLDVFALEALEELLMGYRGTLLFVSHDRAFAEAVATRAAVRRRVHRSMRGNVCRAGCAREGRPRR